MRYFISYLKNADRHTAVVSANDDGALQEKMAAIGIPTNKLKSDDEKDGYSYINLMMDQGYAHENKQKIC